MKTKQNKNAMKKLKDVVYRRYSIYGKNLHIFNYFSGFFLHIFFYIQHAISLHRYFVRKIQSTSGSDKQILNM